MSMSAFPGTQNLGKFPQQWLDEWDFEATASSTKDKDKLVNDSDNNRPNCATEFVEPCYTVWKPCMTF
jgi:hypothetical protein